MTSVRSRLSTKKLSAHKLLVRISPLRRGFYAAVSAILLFGMFSGGVGPLIESGIHPGTVFYSLVVIIALGAAGWNVRIVFDRQEGTVSRARQLFGIPLSAKDYKFSTLKELLLRRIVFFRGTKDQPPGGSSNIGGFGRGGLMTPRRKELGRLYLVPDEEKPDLIEESTDQSELWTVAEELSEFTGLTIRSEEV